jgi:phosphoserine aminotransferase
MGRIDDGSFARRTDLTIKVRMPSQKPSSIPSNPRFSSGPCAKRPGWSLENLAGAALGRSHRAKVGKDKLARAIELTREILRVPADYRIAITPASDTGAVEMALWSLLGARAVDVLAWESFSNDWATDVVKQLKIADARVLTAPYGELPDLTKVDFGHDVVFAWNGTTSGVRVPNADFIPADREGLTICDATSAAFAQWLEFPKLDVTTFSWQKVLGGEAAHGVLILSPRAVERLETYVPAWPLPKIFRLTKGGKLNEAIFRGETINTPSMLCVEDYLDALNWAGSIGGLDALIARADKNAATVAAWIETTPAFAFLAKDPATRSNTSVCLRFDDPAVVALPPESQAAIAKSIVSLVEGEGAGYDFAGYRDAPPGLRIWCGATVESSDVALLTQWIDWAYARATADLS